MYKKELRISPGQFFDYIIAPLFIIFLTWSPNFTVGVIEWFESGKELACVNELFFGKVPYRDIFVQFGPLGTYLEALSMLIFGKHLIVLKLFFYVGTVAGLVIAYLIGRILCRYRFFSFAIALLLLIETFHPYWVSRWGGFRFSLALLAILFAIKFFKDNKNIYIIFAGAFSAITLLMSFDTGLFALAAIGISLFLYTLYDFIHTKNASLKSLAFFVIGILIILCPFTIYFALHKALLPYIITVVTIIKDHGKILEKAPINLWEFLKPANIFSLVCKRLLIEFFYVFFAIYLIYRCITKKVMWKDYAISCLLSYAWFMLRFKVSIFTEIVGPQFQMALQPAIILGFVFLENVFREITELIEKKSIKKINKKNINKLIIFTAIFICGVIYPIMSEKICYKNIKIWFDYQRYRRFLVPYPWYVYPLQQMQLKALDIERAKGIIVPLGEAEKIEGVTGYILTHTKQDEIVFTFPELGAYNFFSNRPCLDRFNMPTCIWTTQQWIKELLADLKRLKPEYIIYSETQTSIAFQLSSKKEFLPEIREYINFNYEKVISFSDIDILKYKNFGK